MVVSFALVVALQRADLRAVAERNAASFRFAILHRDAAWFDRTFTPDFVQRTEEARLDRRTALTQIQKGLLKMHATSLTAKVSAVKAEGKGYAATIRWHGTLPAAIGDRPAVLDVTWQDDQRWVPSAGRWQLRSLTTSRFERTIH